MKQKWKQNEISKDVGTCRTGCVTKSFTSASNDSSSEVYKHSDSKDIQLRHRGVNQLWDVGHEGDDTSEVVLDK